ncbi:hypothetical protein FOZ60_014260 [Perkinsus olseni]|uniref:Uncharacterized protein n=1 Tax=Perkinsus olseni TaxID=32597 RepID=A0A7J6N904_PEROL|nr:hypothetical protein FOZ60_014260 [Perkinsus olseni]
METRKVILEMDPDGLPRDTRDGFAMAAAGDLLYMALDSLNINVLFLEWTRSKGWKLAYHLEFPRDGHRDERRSASLHAVPGVRRSISLQYKSQSTWHQVEVNVVRSQPFKFEAVQNVHVEAERIEGSLVPVMTDPPMYLSVSTDGNSCCLRSQSGLRKVAEFELSGEQFPGNHIISACRWTLAYFKHVRYDG